MGIIDEMNILVTNHAIYQFSLRFGSEAPTSREELKKFHKVIEQEVREALTAHRVSTIKPPTLFPPNDPTCLYVWTENEQRIYSLRHDETPPRFVVTTAMKPERDAETR